MLTAGCWVGCAVAPPASRLDLRRRYEVHEVRDRETAYSIARRYGVDVNELIRLNELSRPERIFVGQNLLIPRLRSGSGGGGASRPPAAKPKTTCRNASGAFATGSGGLLFPPVRGRVLERPQNRDRAEVNIRATAGSPVWASADGKVVFSGRQYGYGRLVVVRHKKLDAMTVYGRNRELCVRVGARVRRGQVIAIKGQDDLLYEVRKGDDAVPSARRR